MRWVERGEVGRETCHTRDSPLIVRLIVDAPISFITVHE